MSCPNRRPAGVGIGLTLAVALSGCHATVRPTSSPRPSPVQQLQHDLDAILAPPSLGHGTWGVVVRSLANQETLYAAHGDRLMMPASNLKVATLAAAAERLTWSYTYETRLMAAGPVDGGVLHGDLVVVGSGDPSIGGRDGPATAVFERWADQIASAGIHRIDGRIVGDDRAFAGPGLGAGWSWDDLDAGYAAAVSALQYNESAVHVTIAPGPHEGDTAAVSVEPAGSGLSIRNHLDTAAADAPLSIQASRLPGSSELELHGHVPLGSAPGVHTLSVDSPTRFFVAALRRALVSRGIDVRGPAVGIDEASDAARQPGARPLVSYRSPPLSALATTLMKVSQNLYAETFVKTMGAATGAPTAAGGLAAARQTLEGWGVAPGALIAVDGSGLSRYDYITPEALVTILAHVDGDRRLRDPFEAALPIAGRDGTLVRRMKGTPAEGTVRAKTGSMANVRSLAGYVTTADGEKLAFAILANGFETPPELIDQATDAIVVRLAEFSRRTAEARR